MPDFFFFFDIFFHFFTKKNVAQRYREPYTFAPPNVAQRYRAPYTFAPPILKARLPILLHDILKKYKRISLRRIAAGYVSKIKPDALSPQESQVDSGNNKLSGNSFKKLSRSSTLCDKIQTRLPMGLLLHNVLKQPKRMFLRIIFSRFSLLAT